MSEPSLPRCAVLLAAYNGTTWIAEQVQSICGQQAVAVTVFISVDRSDVNTYELCRTLAAANPAIQLLSFGEVYGSGAQNFFRLLRDVDFSGFDAVALADQDDIWFPHKLARACTQLAAGFGAYSSNVIAQWPSGQQRLIDKAQPARQWDYLFEAAGPGCTYVLKPALANQIKAVLQKQPDTRQIILHDWLIYALARSHGYRWFIDKEPGMIYRQHAHNHLGVNNGWAALGARLHTFMSGKWLTQARLIAHLCDQQHTDFVRSWSALDRKALWFLIRNAGQCRRRLRDRWVFRLLCGALLVRGIKDR
jgi:rhamnosyltransferase